MKPTARLTGVVAFAALMAASQSSPQWVTVASARNHRTVLVPPVLPAGEHAARANGTVALQVTISGRGRVTAVQPLSGDPALIPAVEEAVKRWRYRPFVRAGHAVAVVAEVDWTFPALHRTATQKKAVQDYGPAFERCQQLVHARQLAEAQQICRQAVAISDRLPPSRRLERSTVRTLLANALLLDHRTAAAIPFYQQALAIDRTVPHHESDADFATDHVNLGQAWALTGNFARADPLYARAVQILRAAIVALPSMKADYTDRLRSALRDDARVKLSLGHPLDAARLLKEAAELK